LAGILSNGHRKALIVRRNYHLFPALKKKKTPWGNEIRKRRGGSSGGRVVPKGATVEWYDAGIQKLVTRMQKVFLKNGDYIEK